MMNNAQSDGSGANPKRRNRNNRRKKPSGGGTGNPQETALHAPKPPTEVSSGAMDIVPPAPPAKRGGMAKVSSTMASYVTQSRFADLPVAAGTRKAIHEVLRYEFMTQVQAQTLPVILQGVDCLAKAKTGTGKTLAFLIPTIENILKMQEKNMDGNPICSTILSPTRELASQISAEASKLCTFLKMNIVTIFGGTSINKDKNRLMGRVDILVATPGRMIDHLENTPNFSQRINNVRVLIMDEADQLLEMGFKVYIIFVPLANSSLQYSHISPPLYH
jgi:ATP-dependent RNA helicase MSS116